MDRMAIDPEDLEEFKMRNNNDLNLAKMALQRSESVAYVQHPAPGNLALYMKSTRMNKVSWARAKTPRVGKRSNSSDNLFNKILKKGQVAHMVTRKSIDNSVTASRYLEYHDNKINKLLGHDEK